MPNYYKENCDCPNRVKPKLLRDVKTEGLLVFARTALERYFEKVDEVNFTPKVGSEEDTVYVYDTLRFLRDELQKHVVNANYLVKLVEDAKVQPFLRQLAKYEEPLMNYYDVMAIRVESYYRAKKVYLPEFLIICILGQWILEEEKSVELYPFLKEVDFLLLTSKFEENRQEFERDGECIISEIFDVSITVIEQLKKVKYKANKMRVSKTRKKKAA